MAKRKRKQKWTLAQKIFVVASILIAISLILGSLITPGVGLDGGALHLPLTEMIF
jgi:hypothetical protein